MAFGGSGFLAYLSLSHTYYGGARKLLGATLFPAHEFGIVPNGAAGLVLAAALYALLGAVAGWVLAGGIARWRSIGVFSIGFLCGCAAGTPSFSAAAKATEPDCSFRSPTTCWTVSGRFPAVSSKATAEPRDSTLTQPSPVLASGADSARSAMPAYHGYMLVIELAKLLTDF
jgi:hypothetical protein